MKTTAIIIRHGLIAALAVFIAVSPVAASTHRPTLIHGAPTQSDIPADRWYVTIPGGDEDRLLEIFHALRAAGATHMQCFLPDVIVCDIPVDVDPQAVAGGRNVVTVRCDDTERLESLALSIQPAVIERSRVERSQTPPRIRDDASGVSPAATAPSGISSQAIPVEAIQESMRAARASADPNARLIFQNSEILAGTVLMQLVLPESDYPETWGYQSWNAESMLDVELALYYMALDFEDDFPNANINFVYKWYRQVLIKAEPIYTPDNNDKFWIALTMAALGYSGDERSVLATVHQFNENARIRSGVDWVFTAFVANAVKKKDHRFTDARDISWGFVGGPYFVTSYPAGHLDGYDGLKIVFKHEIGHIFWGVEEDIGTETDCNTRSGYLDILNRNKVVEYSPIDYSAKGCPDGENPVPCLMNELFAYVLWVDFPCHITTAMWGISDENENGVPDALDRAPVIEFEAADVETVLTPPPYMNVHVHAVPVPNRNPQQPPELRRDYAAPIQDISVRVGGVPPYTVVPSQIGSDGYEADFQVDLPALLPGPLDILVDARNEFNATSETRVKRYVYVHLKYVTFNVRHPNDGIEVSWEMLGDTFGAFFQLIRTDEVTGEEVIVAEGFGPSGPIANGFTPYSVLDRMVEIGRKYTYRVRGTIDLPHRDTTLHKVVESLAIPAQGAVPRTHRPQSPISNTAPNPFSDKTWISVSIPYVDTPAPGTPSESADLPSTFICIDVFDVLGRRVAELYRHWVIGSAVTVSWDGRDAAGQLLPTGMYFVRAEVGTVTEVRKVILIH